MPRSAPNPSVYEVHFPSFRQVEWNPDEMDIGAIVQGEIGQSLVRNTVFDRALGLWRLMAGDSVGRIFSSGGSPNSTILSSATTVVPAGGIQLLGANPNRGGVYLENISTESFRLGYALPITTGIIEFPNDTFVDMVSYTGVLVANAAISASVCQVLVIEYS